MTFPFEFYYRLSSYGMLAAAFAMLASTRQIDVVTFGGYVLALVAGFVFDGREIWPVSRRLANWLRIGYLPFFVFDWQILRIAAGGSCNTVRTLSPRPASLSSARLRVTGCGSI